MSAFVIAVPAKGRLMENAENYLRPRRARADQAARRARVSRRDRGTARHRSRVPVGAGDRPAARAGAVHFGITGEDLVRETIAQADDRVVLVEPLGFGFANVVVAVPQAWIDVRSMADLDDVATAFRLKRDRRMRVATKYVNLTRGFFAEHGIVDYHIVESAGATEGAPAAGTAELIVDITTTGTTLAANGLKVIEDGVILRSQANLVAARAASGARASARRRAIVLDRIAAYAARRRLSRAAHALSRLQRCAARRRKGKVRRRNPVRRSDLVRHADAALSAGRGACARDLPARAWRIDRRGRRTRLRVRARQPALREAGSGVVVPDASFRANECEARNPKPLLESMSPGSRASARAQE